MWQAAGTGLNFINLPARRGNSAVDSRPEQDDKSEPQKPKGQSMYDFQFFNEPAIRAIEDQEYDWSLRRRTIASLVREAKQKERRERMLQRNKTATPTGTSEQDNENDDADDADAPAVAPGGFRRAAPCR
jgi:hypothetical protein